jgi:hypothetical protein
MTALAFGSALATLLALAPMASPAADQTAPAAPIPVGVLNDPCAALDPMPPIVADYMKLYAAAKASDQSPPPITAAGMKIYSDWQNRLQAEDFPDKRMVCLSPDFPRATETGQAT